MQITTVNTQVVKNLRKAFILSELNRASITDEAYVNDDKTYTYIINLSAHNITNFTLLRIKLELAIQKFNSMYASTSMKIVNSRLSGDGAGILIIQFKQGDINENKKTL